MNSFLYLYFKLERKTKRGKSLSDWPVVSPHLIPIRSAMAADDIFLPAVLNRASGLGFFVCLFCFVVVVVFRRNHLLFRRANWFRTDSFWCHLRKSIIGTSGSCSYCRGEVRKGFCSFTARLSVPRSPSGALAIANCKVRRYPFLDSQH